MRKTNKFEYYYFVIYYALCILDDDFGKVIGKAFDKLFTFLFLVFTTKAFRERHQEVLDRMEAARKSVYQHDEPPDCYYLRKILFFYEADISFFALAFIYHKFHYDSTWLTLLLLAIPAVASYFISDRLIYNDKLRKKYFKKFGKKDKLWHRKWKAIAVVLCLGAMPSVLFSFWLAALL